MSHQHGQSSMKRESQVGTALDSKNISWCCILAEGHARHVTYRYHVLKVHHTLGNKTNFKFAQENICSPQKYKNQQNQAAEGPGSCSFICLVRNEVVIIIIISHWIVLSTVLVKDIHVKIRRHQSPRAGCLSRLLILIHSSLLPFGFC